MPGFSANRNFAIFIIGLVQAITFTTVCGQALDSIPRTNQKQIVLPSNALGEDRTVWIHLPAGYSQSTDRYPVLYLLDGGSHFKYVSEMVDYLAGVELNYIPNMIVVGIPNTDRARDFVPIFNAQNAQVGGADRFLRFIKDELIPYVERSYRTQPYRILEGHSLGGLFAVYVNALHPDLFQASIVISPALSGVKDRAKVVQDFGAQLRGGILKKKMFVTLGDEDTEGVDLLTRQLKANASRSFQWKYENFKNENHFSVPFKSMYDGLRFIYSRWHTEVFLNPDTIPYPVIERHFEKLSDEFGYTILPSEEFLNECGYQQLRYQHIAEAIGFFKKNIELHPGSFNVYDSMGEAYLLAGQKDLAIQFYEKSIALNPGNENGKAMLKALRGN